MGVAVEAAELMEHFLWVESEASREVLRDPVWLSEAAEEMADVACLLLTLSNTLGIDLSDAILKKIAKNALKYPAAKYRGRSGGKSEVSHARVSRAARRKRGRKTT
jgi:NTP pyrophosphatase (non-canonical NTP hydrolase)